MAENSAIEWTDHTFNPWVGCTKVSPACDHCYAEGWAKRTGQSQLWAGERRRTSEANWREPLRWNRQAGIKKHAWQIGVDMHGGDEAACIAAGYYKPEPTRVFCASLADVFDNKVPPEWRRDLFDLIAATPHLDWLLLTKRSQNIVKMVDYAARQRETLNPNYLWPWPNVWLGTTVENQEEADRRIPHLRAVPARVRFLSVEPMLGPVRPKLDGIHWVICGGESGPGARPMNPDWARSLRDQCQDASVAFFMKQMGGTVKLRMPPIPDDLMIREFPV